MNFMASQLDVIANILWSVCSISGAVLVMFALLLILSVVVKTIISKE